MSWTQKLYQVYEDCSSEIGTGNPPLYPIYHTTAQVHIEAVIDSAGNWCKNCSRVLTDKKEMTTIIPCTESSASRSGSAAGPHPLFDKLIYLAGDYVAYGGKERKNTYKAYMAQLKDWCDSPYGNKQIRAIYRYLKKGRLVEDLVKDQVLPLGEDGKVLDKWTGANEDKPRILQLLPGGLDAVVRLSVVTPKGKPIGDKPIWQDPKMWESFMQYEDAKQRDKDFCYVLGKEAPVAVLNPKKIRNAGDQAKLISYNDRENFTYRGRFTTAREAFSISREATEKVHNALRWLIGRQGEVQGTQVILAFGKGGKPMPLLLQSSLRLCLNGEEGTMTTKETLVQRLNAYAKEYNTNNDVVIMGLDSATRGRVSVFYYKEMPESAFMQNIIGWHTSCDWLHSYVYPKTEKTPAGKPIYKRAEYYGAPSLKDIIEAAYGDRAKEELRKSTIKRLLPCIAEGRPLPPDIMRSAVNRASCCANKEQYQIQKECRISCALVKKYVNGFYHKEVVSMALDKENKDRSYLFGRALAYMNEIEHRAYSGIRDYQVRRTNAQRMMNAYRQYPARTYMAIRSSLVPYMNQLELKDRENNTNYLQWLEQGLQEVMSQIGAENMNNKPLSALYLVGYDSQTMDLMAKSKIAVLKGE